MSGYYYFGQDAKGYFADTEAGERCYLHKDLWMEVIRAASVPTPTTNRVRLKIQEQWHVDVYEDGQRVKSASLPIETTEI